MLQFLNWLKRRVFAEDRVDFDEIMQGREYKVLEIVKETKASLAIDDFWFRFNEDDKFEDTVRGLVVSNYD